MDPVQIILLGLLLPACVAGTALALALLTRKEGSVPALGWAIALGFGVSYVVMLGWTWPPREATHWLAYIALAGAAASTLEAQTTRFLWPILVRLLVCAGAVALLLRLPLQHTWSPAEGALLVAIVAGVITLAWTLADALARRERSSASAFLLGLNAAAAGAALLLAGNAKGIQLAAALGAGILVWWVFAQRFESLRSTRGGVGVPILMIGALVTIGTFLADMPRATAILLVLAPVGGWAARFPWIRSKPGVAKACRYLVPILLAGAGVLLGVDLSDSSGY